MWAVPTEDKFEVRHPLVSGAHSEYSAGYVGALPDRLGGLGCISAN